MVDHGFSGLRIDGLCGFVALSVALTSGVSGVRASVVVDFEDLPLASDSFYAGAVEVDGFSSGGAFFNNTHIEFDGGFFWTGWSYSNMTDTTTPGYGNQFSAIAGGGAAGSSNYGVAFSSTPGEAYIDLPPGASPLSVLITNTTYAFLSIRDGDDFADPFGGPSGDEPDRFWLTVTGLDEAGLPVGSVEFDLADYRFENNDLDYVIDAWMELDLSSLVDARTLSFTLDSTDIGDFGMNTPAYFALDDLQITPEPATLGLLVLGVTALIGRKRRCHVVLHRAGSYASRRLQPARRLGSKNAFLRPMCSITCLTLSAVSAQVRADTPFAVVVHDYAPAPGQFVNNDNFNDPQAALGAPVAGGVGEPGVSSLVTLGGFGGSITLGFEATVLDHRLNPFGMDAIVFTNAFWSGGNPEAHWAECATIEIALDLNGNGLPDGPPDEPWALIPGSHICCPMDQLTFATWDDDTNDDTYPPAPASWLPPGAEGVWTTHAYALPVDPFGAPVVVNPSEDPDAEGIFGYAEYTPTLRLGDLDGDNVVDDPDITPEVFYVVPDDPLVVGITTGSGGGDAFDIAWAIDPVTGEPANLPGFDFLRITSAVNIVSELFGEKSPEIDAAADVAPDTFCDADDDADVDLLDLAALQLCFAPTGVVDPDCDRFDRDGDGAVDLTDAAACTTRTTGPA